MTQRVHRGRRGRCHMRRGTWLVLVGVFGLSLSTIGIRELRAAGGTVPVNGAEQRSAARTRALQRLGTTSASEWQVRWDPATETPQTVFGSRTKPLDLRTQDVASAVRGFMLEHADLFRMRPGRDDYRVT